MLWPLLQRHVKPDMEECSSFSLLCFAVLSLNREVHFLLPGADPLQEQEHMFLHTSASRSILLFHNCSARSTLTWSPGFFKSFSPVSCNTENANYHFQPSGFPSLSIPYLESAQSSTQLSASGEQAWPPSLLPPILLYFSYIHVLHIFVPDPERHWSPKWARSEAQRTTGTEKAVV